LIEDIPGRLVTQAGIHAKPVDIWAMGERDTLDLCRYDMLLKKAFIIGVTLYCMLRGCLPFEADNPLDLFEAIKEQE
jgi:serine/threonine protein kinase